MNIEIIEDKENKLLNRRGVKFRVIHDGGTPSKKKMRSELVSFLKTKSELLVIDGMRSEFGKRETIGYAKVYDNEDRVQKLEHTHILLRNFPSAKSGENEASPGGA